MIPSRKAREVRIIDKPTLENVYRAKSKLIVKKPKSHF